MNLNPTSALIRYNEQKKEYVSYKDFDVYPDRTLKAFKDFYTILFPAVLSWYYTDRTKSIILGATRYTNRVCESNGLKKVD